MVVVNVFKRLLSLFCGIYGFYLILLVVLGYFLLTSVLAPITYMTLTPLIGIYIFVQIRYKLQKKTTYSGYKKNNVQILITVAITLLLLIVHNQAFEVRNNDSYISYGVKRWDTADTLADGSKVFNNLALPDSSNLYVSYYRNDFYFMQASGHSANVINVNLKQLDVLESIAKKHAIDIVKINVSMADEVKYKYMGMYPVEYEYVMYQPVSSSSRIQEAIEWLIHNPRYLKQRDSVVVLENTKNYSMYVFESNNNSNLPRFYCMLVSPDKKRVVFYRS